MIAPVVRVSGFRKTYGRVVAVDEISFDVLDGEIFGLIVFVVCAALSARVFRCE